MKIYQVGAQVQVTENNIKRRVVLTFEHDRDTLELVLVKVDGRRLADDPNAKPKCQPGDYAIFSKKVGEAPFSWQMPIFHKLVTIMAGRGMSLESIIDHVKSTWKDSPHK
jgi:hypothetical protein